MKLSDRYILGKIWPPALLAAFIISFVVVGGSVRSEMRAVTDSVPISQMAVLDILRLGLYVLPTLWGYIFPITYLMGVMYVFSRLAQSNELTALKAAGISLRRVVMPVVVLGLLLSVAAFFIAERMQPWAYERLVRLISQELPMRMTLESLPAGVMHEVGDWRVYIAEREDNGDLRGIVILQPNDDGANAFYADSARLVMKKGSLHLELRDGYFIPSDPRQHFMFKSLVKEAPMPKMLKRVLSGEGMTLSSLLSEEKRLARRFDETGALPVGVELRNVRQEVKNRLAFPLMCLAVSFVGAPIGARSKKAGQSYAFSIGLSIIGAYFILRKLVELEALLPLALTVSLGQMPNLLLCLLGIILLWRVDRV